MPEDFLKKEPLLGTLDSAGVKQSGAPSAADGGRFNRHGRVGHTVPGRHIRRGPLREGRPKPEFEQRIISVRRVARVAAGGRRFNFSVALVIGNRKGSVGVGFGKGADTTLAIEKAARNAKKNLLTIALTKNFSIPRIVKAKYSSARVMIQPAPGRGIVAGSALRTVIQLAGVRDVTAKIISPSKNKPNIARATVKALSAFSTNNQQTILQQAQDPERSRGTTNNKLSGLS